MFCSAGKLSKAVAGLLCLIAVSCATASSAGAVTYEQALEVRKAGNFERAEQIFLALLEKDRDNAELWFQLGLAQRFQGKRAAALASQQHALSIAPENHDIRLELARLHSWNGDYDLAGTMVNRILADLPDYVDAQQLAASNARARNAPPDPGDLRNRLDIGFENSSFPNLSRPGWRQSSLRFGRRVGADTTFHLSAKNSERGDQADRQYEVGIARKFNDKYNGFLAVGYAPGAVFSPKWRLETGAEARLAAGRDAAAAVWLTAYLRHDRYDAGTSTTLKPGIRYQVTENWQIHVQHIALIDENRHVLAGHAARVDWQTPLPDLRLYAGGSRAPETEDTDVIYTSARFAGLFYQISPGLTLSASYAREDRQGSYTRTVVSTALSVRF